MPSSDVPRSVLPIPEVQPVGLTTYDAKDPATSYPPITPLRPPAGAPNVLVIMLDDAGFTSAAKWYVEGFAKRSGVKVRLDFAPEVERLPDTIETALFRVLQESLTNVHRHSGTSEVDVRFCREAQTVILEVRDYGRGIHEELLSRWGQAVLDSGVGVAGMRERLSELKGDLEIASAGKTMTSYRNSLGNQAVQP